MFKILGFLFKISVFFFIISQIPSFFQVFLAVNIYGFPGFQVFRILLLLINSLFLVEIKVKLD